MTFRNDYTITINYPTSASNKPRWGYENEPHPLLTGIIGRNRGKYEDLLRKFLDFKENFVNIPLEEDKKSPLEPYLKNPWFPGLDSFSLYCLIGMFNPATYIEVGSGTSTKFARRSSLDNNSKTLLISIDPEPRAEIDQICDNIVRQPVEKVDLSVFDILSSNDILFIDNSHRCFMNSDATVLFLDVIPRLKSGVLVHIHDIFLPYDYPPHWAERYYSEQYLLAAYLLGGGAKTDILLPNAFISKDASLHGICKNVFANLEGVSSGGGSFWLRTR